MQKFKLKKNAICPNQSSKETFVRNKKYNFRIDSSSLIEEFHIPKDDYFHVIEELENHQIKYPESYLGISHSEEIIYVQITAGQGRTLEQKKKLYHQIATRISSSTTILINNVIIVLLENNGLENWSFGNGEIQEPKHLKK